MMKFAAVLAIVLVGSSLGAELAPNPPDSLKTYQIDPIFVLAAIPGQSSAGIDLVQPAQDKPGIFLNAREALADIPGLSTSSGSKDEGAVKMRGFRNSDLRIMIDGRPIIPGYFGSVDLNNLDMSDIEYVMLIKGPSSGALGSGTMGGTINLISRKASQEKWLAMELGLKRNNTHQLGIRSSHDFDSWSYKIFLQRNHTDGFALSEDFESTAFENGGIRNNGEKTSYSWQSQFQTDLAQVHRLTVSVDGTWQPRKQVPSSIYESRFRVYEDWLRTGASVKAEIYPSDTVELHSTVYWDYQGDHYLEYVDPSYEHISLDSRLLNHSVGFDPRLHVNLSDNLILDTGLRLEHYQTRRKDTAGYSEWTLFRTMASTAFGSLSYTNPSLVDVLLNLAINRFDVLNKVRHYYSFGPGISLSKDMGRRAKLSLSIAQNNSNPRMRQLYSATNGNPDLQVQESIKTELGATYRSQGRWGFFSLSGALYYNKIYNLIDRVGDQYQNIFDYYSYGSDLVAVYSPLSWWETTANYAYLDYPTSGDYVITESPHHSLSVAQRIALSKTWSAQYRLYYGGKRYSQDAVGVYHALEAYTKHDISISKTWRDHRITALLENITDENYFSEYGFPAAGLGFGIKVELLF